MGDGLPGLPEPQVDPEASEAGEAWPPILYGNLGRWILLSLPRLLGQQWGISSAYVPGQPSPMMAQLSPWALLVSDRAGGPGFIHVIQVPRG